MWEPIGYMVTTIISVVGLIVSIYYASSTKKKSEEKEAAEKASALMELNQTISNLPDKEYIDEKMEKEILGLKYDLNDKIENLKSDMKVQLNELKDDVKSQKEISNDMRSDVIRTKESAKHAHELITSTNKRIDDLVQVYAKNINGGRD